MLGFAQRLFGSSNDRKLKPLRARVQKINALEPEFEKLSPDELKAKTAAFRERLANGEKLDSLLEEAFATVREAAKRTLGQRHYDVQLMGGMVLHSGAIAEMRTGEGKTLVATAPVYLNALEGKGVHVITVNDYLASRDAEWMGQVYRYLGLSVGSILHGLTDPQRREAYACDVTYGTNNEFGFDYLRDNMKYELRDMTQRGHRFAIVDEVDSILIDEARTPLIISGPTDDRTDLYKAVDAIIPLLQPEHFELDEKQRSCVYTEEGSEFIEQTLTERGVIEEGGLYDPANVTIVHHCNQALRAHKLFHKDKDYIVRDGEVMLIDEFTGRMMPGRRLSEGLHQAIEAKEGAKIQPENQTLASITFQNYFRLYDKLAGMTGTALTEAAEFAEIYGLEVVDMPTNRPIQRIDDDDVVFRTRKEKYRAIIEDIVECQKKGQPMLVGTASIERSDEVSAALKAAKIEHEVLNAREHEREAHIIAQAGKPGAVTVATNMAGRGTDIQLGGNLDFALEEWLAAEKAAGREPDEAATAAKRAALKTEIDAAKKVALDAGGLYVLGTERHESRRIDNQLRGRTGRQGDPGRSKFYISLEDDLLRIFAAERLDGILQKLGIEEDEAIVHPWMNKALETSQKKVEARNFDIRKNLLKFDNVVNDQRKAIYEQRIEFMSAPEVAETIADMRDQAIEAMVMRAMPPKAYAEQWDIEGLAADVRDTLGLTPPLAEWAQEEGIANDEVTERLTDAAAKAYAAKTTDFGADRMRWIEKQVLLQTLDMRWREHLHQLDMLRSVIHLRGYAQRDPLNEYKGEAFALFENLLGEMRVQVTRFLMVALQPEQARAPAPPPPPAGRVEIHADPRTGENEMAAAGADPLLGMTAEEFDRFPRNAPCPCGSGKKFKHCHGAVGARQAVQSA